MQNWYPLPPSQSPYCKDTIYLRKDDAESKTHHFLTWLQNCLEYSWYSWSTVWHYFRQIIPTQISHPLCSKTKPITFQLKNLTLLLDWSVYLFPCYLARSFKFPLLAKYASALKRKKKKKIKIPAIKGAHYLRKMSLENLQTEQSSQSTLKLLLQCT